MYLDKSYRDKDSEVVITEHESTIIPLLWVDIGYGPPSPDCYPKQVPRSYSYELTKSRTDYKNTCYKWNRTD